MTQAVNSHKKLTDSAAAINLLCGKCVIDSTVKIIPLRFAFFYPGQILMLKSGGRKSADFEMLDRERQAEEFRVPLSVKAVVVIRTISTSPKITCGS